MHGLNIIDIAIIVVLVGGIFSGFREGFVVQVAAILGSFLALAVAKAEYVPVRRFLATFASNSPWLTVVSYLIVFFAVWVAIIVLARILRRVTRLLLLGWADRLGGAVIGFLESAIVVELLLYLAKRVPAQDLHRLLKHSRLTPTFLHFLPYIDRFFPHIPHVPLG